MESKLLDTQIQLEELQTLLIHKETKRQELIERSEKEDLKILQLEQQCSQISLDIDYLNEELSLEKVRRSALGVKLQQKKNSLRKTHVMLDASQQAEARLTAEAKRLLKTLSESHSDGEKLLRRLQEAKDSDTERRKATTYIHSSMCIGLEKIISYLKDHCLSKSDYYESIMRCSKDSCRQEHEYIEKTLELMKEITLCVTKLKSTMLSQLVSDNGILSSISTISEKALDGIESTRLIFDEGEKYFSLSLKKSYSQLEENLGKVQCLDNGYKSKSDNLLEALFKSISESKKKVVAIIASTHNSLSSIRKSNLMIISDLSVIHSQWHESLQASVSNIKINAKNQCLFLDNSIGTCSEEIMYQDKMEYILSEQSSLINKMVVSHLEDVSSQMSLISIQGEHFSASQKRQRELQEKFLHNMMNGLYKLITSQMEIIRRDQEEHIASFEKRKKCLMESNIQLNNTANFIFDKVRERNKSLTEHIQHEYRNNRNTKIKDFIIELKATFSNLEKMAVNQNISTQQHKRMVELKMKEFFNQSHLLDLTDKTINKCGDDFLTHLSGSLLDCIHNGILEMTKEGVYMCKLASDKVINNTTLALKKMREPRLSLISNILTRFQILSNNIYDGNAEIDVITREKFTTLNDLCKNIITIGNNFVDFDGKKHRDEVDENKIFITTCTNRQSTEETSVLSSSLNEATSLQIKINDFVTHMLHTEEKKSPLRSKDYNNN